MTASNVNGSICRQVWSPMQCRAATLARTHARSLSAGEDKSARALAMGHQLLVTGSAYAIDRRRDREWALNGPDVAAAFSDSK